MEINIVHWIKSSHHHDKPVEPQCIGMINVYADFSTKLRRSGQLCCLALSLVLGLSGCISSPKALRQESQTMLEIYRGAVTEGHNDSGENDALQTTFEKKRDVGKYQTSMDGDKLKRDAKTQTPPLDINKALPVSNSHLKTDRDVQLAENRNQQATSPIPLHASFTRHAQNEIEQLFPRLPNPDILIYVHPHLSTAEQVPIPGYTTAMPLYERVHYAMPGDYIPARRSVNHPHPVHQPVRP
jgi:conjugative transfer region lipoprotein (TIGR03751 family)